MVAGSSLKNWGFSGARALGTHQFRCHNLGGAHAAAGNRARQALGHTEIDELHLTRRREPVGTVIGNLTDPKVGQNGGKLYRLFTSECPTLYIVSMKVRDTA